jgi:broad-specificity NMP kinase
VPRHVTLVTGSPCAGKTTYVQQHAGPDDTVLDMDAIAVDLGSDRDWRHRQVKVDRANRRMRTGIWAVATSTTGTSWVIRCVADGHQRQHLAAKLKADQVLVLKPDLDVVLDRASHRPDPIATQRLVRDWYTRYTPADCDTLIA